MDHDPIVAFKRRRDCRFHRLDPSRQRMTRVQIYYSSQPHHPTHLIYKKLLAMIDTSISLLRVSRYCSAERSAAKCGVPTSNHKRYFQLHLHTQTRKLRSDAVSCLPAQFVSESRWTPWMMEMWIRSHQVMVVRRRRRRWAGAGAGRGRSRVRGSELIQCPLLCVG